MSEDNLLWMNKEMEKQNVIDFGRHIIDEMATQDDLIITKSADACGGICGQITTSTLFARERNETSDKCNPICFS